MGYFFPVLERSLTIRFDLVFVQADLGNCLDYTNNPSVSSPSDGQQNFPMMLFSIDDALLFIGQPSPRCCEFQPPSRSLWNSWEAPIASRTEE